MGILKWTITEAGLTATSEDNGARFSLEMSGGAWVLRVDGNPFGHYDDLAEAGADAQEHAQRDEDPANLWRDAETPFAANH